MKPEPSTTGKRQNWTRKHLAMLGKYPDSVVAKKIGVHLATVLQKRQKLGIPASRPAKSIHWPPHLIGLLGKLPDGQIARIGDMNKLTVWKKRQSLGIPCYARKSKSWHRWTQKEIALLGKMPDIDVAMKTGIHKASVAWKRGKLKIPPFTQKRPKKLLTDWTRKEITLLGKMPDATVAATLDVAPSAVRLKRISLGIPPCGRKKA